MPASSPRRRRAGASPRTAGTLIVLVEHGRVIERNLRRERMTHDELAAEARQQQIADLDRVRLGVLETNGRMSFILED